MTKLSTELTNKIVDLIERGWSSDTICTKLVLEKSAFYHWGNWGMEILNDYEFDELLAIRGIEENASRRDKHMMKLYVRFVCRIQDVLGQQIGNIEEVVYAGAMNDPKAALQWLGVRAPETWAKKDTPAVVIETHPIKQIVIHNEDIPQLEVCNTETAEYVDD